MYAAMASGGKKGPTKRGPAQQPMTEAPPHPDPTRRLPDPIGQKNGYTPKPTLPSLFHIAGSRANSPILPEPSYRPARSTHRIFPI